MLRYGALILILCSYSCSYFKKKVSLNESEEKKPYKMPLNPFPTFMEQFFSYQLPVYRMEIKPQSLVFDCTKRNDAELFWCGLDAEFLYPDQSLPHKITMLISASIDKKDVAFYHSFVKRLASGRSHLFLLGIFPFENERSETPEILGKYYGIYNAQECFNWYGYFEDCPKGSKAIK